VAEVIKAAFRRAGPVGLAFDETPDYGEGLLIACLNNHIPDPMPCRSKGEFRQQASRIPEGSLILKLVASSDDRALAIRDHLVPLVRNRGAIEFQRGAVRLVTLQTGPWAFAHWTPFNELDPGEASSPGYRHALERQHQGPGLPYGLDVWHDGTKVLTVLWTDDGASEVTHFARGSWEDDALAL
jgi:hypothetical protein